MDYQKFIEHKTQLGGYYGFDPIELHPGLKDFQADLVTWALQKGRGAIFADTGLGKTFCQAVKNLEHAANHVTEDETLDLFASTEDQS